MGILLTSALPWSSAHSKLVTQAQRVLFAKNVYQRPLLIFLLLIYLRFFYLMVKPILCYASQILGYEYMYVDMI